MASDSIQFPNLCLKLMALRSRTGKRDAFRKSTSRCRNASIRYEMASRRLTQTPRTGTIPSPMGRGACPFVPSALPRPGSGGSNNGGRPPATAPLIVPVDGDPSYPPDAISYLIEAFLHLDVDFLNASRFPVRDRKAMSFKHRFGNWMLSLAMSLLYFRWVRDSQSGMWVFRRSILQDMRVESDGMSLSVEIKIEALKTPTIRFAEMSIMYSSRLGEIKLNPWRDGLYNLWFLIKKRFTPRIRK